MDSLASRVEADGPLAARDAVRLVVRLCRTLEVQHAEWRSHGRISPKALVMMGPRVAQACLLTADAASTDVAFFSPERSEEDGPSVLDDAWAVAMTLYVLLTGWTPSKGWDDADTRARARAFAPPPLAVFDAGDDTLEAWVERALAKDPATRFPSMQKLRAPLEAWLEKHGATEEEGALPWADDAGRERAESAVDLSHLPPPPAASGAPRRKSSPDAEGPPSESNPLFSVADEETTLPREGGPPMRQLPPPRIHPPAIARQRSLPPLDPAPEPAPEATHADEDVADDAEDSPEEPADRETAPYSPPAKKPLRPALGAAPASRPGDEEEERPTLTPIDHGKLKPHRSRRPPVVLEEPSSDEPVSTSQIPSEPPPFRSPTNLSRPPPPPPPSRTFRWIVAGIVVTGLAYSAYLLMTRTTYSEPEAEVGSSAASGEGPKASVTLPATSADAKVPNRAPSAAVSAVGITTAVASEDPTQCLLPLFASGSFSETSKAKLEFVCRETDPSMGAPRVREAVVLAGSRGVITDAMREWAVLGVYELAAFAALRGHCCPAAAQIELPASTGPCPPLAESLREISRISRPGSSDAEVDAALKSFDGVIRCLARNKQIKVLGDYKAPSGGEDTAFKKTLSRARSSAKRPAP